MGWRPRPELGGLAADGAPSALREADSALAVLLKVMMDWYVDWGAAAEGARQF